MKGSVLVLEGGAMRSLFTSGVLDALMKNNINIDCTVGVSAGALTGMNYVSEQKGRSASININYCKDSKYIGIRAIKNNHGLIGFDYLFNEISKKHNPFDEETFLKSDKRFVVGATNCITGKTEFFEKNHPVIYDVVQASASMPLISKIVDIRGKPYLDGAIDCNVPIDWAMEQGYEKIIVVLTRNKEYRKKEISKRMKAIYKANYKLYPRLLESIYNRSRNYNKIYEKIEELRIKNKIIVLQPNYDVRVSRLERNQHKLRNLYEEGIEKAEGNIQRIKQYLQIEH